jgi:hypothetical protein
MRKLTLMLLLLTHLSVCILNGQERYTNTEIDHRIDKEKVLLQKEIELSRKEIEHFRREIER